MEVCHAGKNVYKTQGAQDECIKALNTKNYVPGSPFEVSNKDNLLKGRIYHTIYEKLQYVVTVNRRKNLHDNVTRTAVCATLTHGQCDLISGVDLVLPDPNNNMTELLLNRYIHTVDVEFAGMRTDKACSPEQLMHQGEIFGRFASRHGKKLFVPLALAPLHEHNAVMPSTKHHELKIIITFAEGIETLPEFELCANKIFVKPTSSSFVELPLDKNRYAQLVQRMQYAGPDKIKKGVNKVRLNFNHPTYLIYFWGIDTDKVKRVRLLFDKDEPFFDGTLAELGRTKCLAGYAHMHDVSMIVFSTSSFAEPPCATVNFSRIDNAFLEIETEQEETDLHVVAVSTDMLVYQDGMVGMRYSS